MSIDQTVQAANFRKIVDQDVNTLIEKEKTYKGSWQKRGGVGAFMMLARKWDRIENICESASRHYSPESPDSKLYSGYSHAKYDVISILISEDNLGMGGKDGSLLAEIRDLRCYLTLVESALLAHKQLSSYQTVPQSKKDGPFVIQKVGGAILFSPPTTAGDPDTVMEHAAANDPDRLQSQPVNPSEDLTKLG